MPALYDRSAEMRGPLRGDPAHWAGPLWLTLPGQAPRPVENVPTTGDLL